MIESRPTPTRATARTASTIGSRTARDPRSNSTILNEQLFIQMLSVERKRTERSSRRFALMLLDSGSPQPSPHAEQVLEKALRGLSQSVRETDLKGWYKSGSIAGVIFTEIGSAQSEAVVALLSTKTTAVLSGLLTMEQINALEVSFHVYPEDSLTRGPRGSSELPLHPDLRVELDRRKFSRVLKRTMDVSGALLGLILSLPVLLAISIAIKLTSKGPLVFRQERLGLGGRRFTFLKFRSMYFETDSTIHKEYVKRLISGTVNGDEGAGSRTALYKLAGDPRVTPVGRFLRRTSLDELPQFVNVLLGDMSLVGPRPSLPYEFDCYDTWHTRRVLAVKPGMTGLWQVGGRSLVAFDDMVRLDLEYAKTWSLALDIRILCRTPRAVLSGEGAC